MTHTGRMSTPIRPGTARRLGLKPPALPPRPLLVIDQPISEGRLAFLLATFTGEIEVRAPLLPAVAAPRRRWWQRRNP